MSFPCMSAPITGFNCGAGELCSGYELIATYTICRAANSSLRKDKDKLSVDATVKFPPGIDLGKTEGWSIAWMA